MTKKSQDELIEELQRVTTKIGEPPTIAEFRKHGNVNPKKYYEVFDSWPAALEAAELDSSRSQQQIPEDELLDDIRRLANEYSEPPTKQQLTESGEYAIGTYINRFGSFNDAIRTAGLEPRDPTTAIEKRDLLTELNRLAEELNRAPTTSDMTKFGEYDEKTYRRQFGSWYDVLEAAGLDPTNRSGERITRKGRTGSPTRKELLDELRYIADANFDDSSETIHTSKTNSDDQNNPDSDDTVSDVEPPSFSDVAEDARYGTSTYVRRFGSFNNAIEAAGFEPRSPPNKIPKDELLAELHRLDEQVQGRVTSTDMDEKGRFATATYQRRFGSWSNALEESGLI